MQPDPAPSPRKRKAKGRQRLPDPGATTFPSSCPECSYSLEGSEGQTSCPECGAPIAPGAACLAIAGVPRQGPGPRWRFWAWIAIAIGAFFGLQCAGFLIVTNPTALGVAWLLIVLAAIGMFATGKQDRRGRTTERVVFTPTGYSREPFPRAGESLAWTPWSDADGWRVRLKPFGAFWCQLKLLRIENGVARPRLVMGFRCPADSRDAVADVVQRFASNEPPSEDHIRALGASHRAETPPREAGGDPARTGELDNSQ